MQKPKQNIKTDYWYYGLEECERCLWLKEASVMTDGTCNSCHESRRWTELDTVL